MLFVLLSDQVRVEFRSFIISFDWLICIFTPDMASTGAQIKPGKRNKDVINTLTLLLSSGIPFTVDMINISILE